MMYIYAGLLLNLSKKEINEDNLRKVLLSAGITVDEERLKAAVKMFKNMDEQTLNEIMQEINKEKINKKQNKQEQQVPYQSYNQENDIRRQTPKEENDVVLVDEEDHD